MSAKIFILLLVCLLMVDTGVKAHDGRIKLCGREFVRMVISSCGSSRLRRHAPELEEAHRDIYSRCSFKNKNLASSHLEVQLPFWLKRFLSPWAGDLLDHMSSDQSPSSGNWEDQQQQQQQHQQQEWTLEHAVSTDQRRTPLQGTGAPLQGTGTPLQGTGTPLEGTGELEVQRVRRDTGPAGLCCRSGCTISELVQFCWDPMIFSKVVYVFYLIQLFNLSIYC